MSNDAKAGWTNALPEELRFWEEIIAGTAKQKSYVENFRRRAAGTDEIASHLAKYLVGRDLSTFDILDVGAGPHSVIGRNYRGKTLNITAVDPLADEYNALIARANIAPAIPTLRGEAEQLSSVLPHRKFDLVYSRNALDHSYDPVAALQEMLNICKPNGVMLIEGKSNEAVRQRFAGLHQWNFMPVDGDLVVWKIDLHYSMKHHLRGYGRMNAQGTAWYQVEITKPAGPI